METLRHTWDDTVRGRRFDHALVELAPQLSRARIQALIKEGAALLNGKPSKPSWELRGGETVELTIPDDRPAEAQPQDLPLDILHEDEHLAVLNKASGMVVHPGDGTPDGTVVNALLHRFGPLSSIGGVQRPGIVHRLDKETSGCLVVARNDAAHQAISAQFAERLTQKTYLAVVQGIPQPPAGEVKNHIGRHPQERQRMAVVPEPAGKFAHTEYRVVRGVGRSSLVECVIHTGRTHQIRVHLQHIGHPILGDSTYGRAGKGAREPAGRVMLHAWKLAFTHPATGRRLAFEAPIPPEFSPWL
jgi:23S rRNA pseudouridine1911/1915/1917 synthase